MTVSLSSFNTFLMYVLGIVGVVVGVVLNSNMLGSLPDCVSITLMLISSAIVALERYLPTALTALTAATAPKAQAKDPT